MLIANAVLSLVNSTLAVIFSEKLCETNRSAVYSVFFSVVCGVIDICVISQALWIRCIVSLAALILVLTVFHHVRLYRAVSAALTCIYLRAAAELTVSCLLFAVMREDFFEAVNGNVFNLALFGLISAAISGGLLYLVWYILSQQPQETFHEAWRHYSFVITVFGVITAIFGSLFSFDESTVSISPIIAAASVATLAMSIVVINFFAEICASYAREKQLHHLRSDYCSVKEQLEVQFQTSQRLRKVRHDIKNHLLNLSALIDSGEYKQARELLREISDTADRLQPALSQSTGNSLIDAVITYKAAVSEIRKIPFEYSLESLPELRIELSDISSVISNLLDNALEAAEYAKDPYVEIRVFMYKDYLTIIVKNSVHYVPEVKDCQIPTTKKDKENHGLGMTIVKEICERNGGVFRFTANGAWFIASAMMMNNHTKNNGK
ncbi:MAG: sensor histidine kinase [Oscillospiraceae bacterium]